MFDSLPSWLRWLILLPIALAGGWVVGYGVFLLNASNAATPDAPIIYIADFTGSVASNLVAFHLAFAIAPHSKARVVATLIVIAIFASLWTIYLITEHGDYSAMVGVTGNLLGCVLGWRNYVHVTEETSKFI